MQEKRKANRRRAMAQQPEWPADETLDFWADEIGMTRTGQYGECSRCAPELWAATFAPVATPEDFKAFVCEACLADAVNEYRERQFYENEQKEYESV